MIFEGFLTVKHDPVSGVSKAGNNYTYQNFVIQAMQEDSRQPQAIALTTSNTSVLDALALLNIGDFVTVNFDCFVSALNGREYNNLRAWAITKK